MATAKKKGKPLGPRVTVQFSSSGGGKDKKNPRYVLMLKSTAEYFGFKSVPIAQVKTKSGYNFPVRGQKGGGSIKIPALSSGAAAKKAGSVKYKSIPVPASANIADTIKFLGTASKNKPKSFVTRDGQTFPISDGKTK